MQYTQPLETRNQRKILFFAEVSSLRELISAFLAMMDCTCVVISSPEELAVEELAAFDAVLMSIDDSGSLSESLIRDLFPRLSGKLLLIGNPGVGTEVAALAERHDLRRISLELWPQQLWPALQDIFAAGGIGDAPQHLEEAHLIFDSFQSTLRPGVRSSYSSARQLAYQNKTTFIDLFIEPRQQTGRVWLAGQVLDTSMQKGENSGLAVVLTAHMKTLAQTSTDEHGEFRMEFECPEEPHLHLRLRVKEWTEIPLGKMDWIKKRLSASTGPPDPADESKLV